MAVRASLRRWHMWLGWLVGMPMLFWTVSGFVMVARPIEEVRGTDLLRDPAPLRLAAAAGRAVRSTACPSTSLTLEPRAAGPRWVIALRRRPRAAAWPIPPPGACLPPLGAADAQREVTVALHRHGARRRGHPHRPRQPADRASAARSTRGRCAMDDGTHFYVDAGSGEVVARRTRLWRVYDFMWGLHIMDLQGREDTHNPWVDRASRSLAAGHDAAGAGAAAASRRARESSDQQPPSRLPPRHALRD